MEVARSLDPGLYLPSFPCSLVLPASSTPLWVRPLPITRFTTNPNCRLDRHSRCSSRRGWDSNADTSRAWGFRFSEETYEEEEEEEDDDSIFGRRGSRKWWSDDSSEDDDDSGFMDESLWDRLWIFKVFKSYGWMLPAIVLSMLLATGPKAFLMALALPLGQSALSLAIDTIWGKSRSAAKPRSKVRKRPFSRNMKMETGEEEEIKYDNKERPTYQSWVATKDGGVEKGTGRRAPGFGGWEELEKDQTIKKEPARPPRRTISKRPQPQTENQGKLGRRGRYKDAPLFLRLLVAVFPFLASWTKLL